MNDQRQKELEEVLTRSATLRTRIDRLTRAETLLAAGGCTLRLATVVGRGRATEFMDSEEPKLLGAVLDHVRATRDAARKELDELDIRPSPAAS